jgi:predicted DNA-binding transcriptional regulator AlpA
MTTNLLKLTEVAEMLGVPPATLRFWRHQGDTGPKSAKLGRRVVYREADVLAWVDAQFEDAPAA